MYHTDVWESLIEFDVCSLAQIRHRMLKHQFSADTSCCSNSISSPISTTQIACRKVLARNGITKIVRRTTAQNQYANINHPASQHSHTHTPAHSITSSTLMLMHPTKLNLARTHNAEWIFSRRSHTRNKLHEKFQIEVAPNILYYIRRANLLVCVCPCTVRVYRMK